MSLEASTAASTAKSQPIPGVAADPSISSPTHSTPDPEALWHRWQALKPAQPGLRAREAAEQLGVSEAELLACHPQSRRLSEDWGALIADLRAVGPVMALTRNHAVVIEKTGPIEEVSIYPEHGMGQVVGEAIDLRLFLRHWQSGFALREPTDSGTRESLQFFDGRGTAVHKIYRVKATDASAWEALIARHFWPQAPALQVAPAPPQSPQTPDDEIDIEALRMAWEAMRNTHDFFGLLRRFQVERRQALRLVGSDLARRVAPTCYRTLFERVREHAMPVMLFVGSPGCIQIHTGPIQRLKTVGPWYNILDPDFNLHLWMDGVAESWLVRKPTDQGVVTSLECYDDAGELLLQCFGKRKGAESESPQWRALLDEITAPGWLR
ncbi:MAG: hemin-degrading factor [Halochromatium sp.]